MLHDTRIEWYSTDRKEERNDRKSWKIVQRSRMKEKGKRRFVLDSFARETLLYFLAFPGRWKPFLDRGGLSISPATWTALRERTNNRNTPANPAAKMLNKSRGRSPFVFGKTSRTVFEASNCEINSNRSPVISKPCSISSRSETLSPLRNYWWSDRSITTFSHRSQDTIRGIIVRSDYENREIGAREGTRDLARRTSALGGGSRSKR